jgi:hypothetical protein
VILYDKNSMSAGAVDVDKCLPIIVVQVDKETLENVLLDGGSRVNLITEEEEFGLGCQSHCHLHINCVWRTKL